MEPSLNENLKKMAEDISNLRYPFCVHIMDTITPEAKLIQFNLLDIYENWKSFLGDRDRSFSRFLHIYLNDLSMIKALKESILALNNLDCEKWNYKNPSENWQRMNLLIKSNEIVYHLVNLTILLRVEHERLLLCLQELFQSQKCKTFNKTKKHLLTKLNEMGYQDFKELVESIDISKVKEKRDKIIHSSGLYFQEFICNQNSDDKIDFDEYLIEVRKEIEIFYKIIMRFVELVIGKKPIYHLKVKLS